MSTTNPFDWSAESIASLTQEFNRATGYTVAKKEGKLIARRSRSIAEIRAKAQFAEISKYETARTIARIERAAEACMFNADNF